MTISKGIVGFDDQLNFGRVVGELSKFCYSVVYIPKRDIIVACCHKRDVKKFKKFKLLESLKIHGGIAFAKIVWR